jgi:hypothetical protein
MGESMRCPFCGWTGATRLESICEYQRVAEWSAYRGPLLSQRDRYECEECRRRWDEVAYRRSPEDYASRAVDR